MEPSRTGRIDEREIREKVMAFSPEWQKFYGDKEVWKGKAEYTRITINTPAKLLREDLWMKEERPLGISLALTIINNPKVVTYFLYFFYTAIFSFLAGGIAGLICFDKFKKYALIGLANVFTLIGFVLAFILSSRFTQKEQQSKRSKVGFVFLFSIIFLGFLSLQWSIFKFI
jgi:hypothetical protein